MYSRPGLDLNGINSLAGRWPAEDQRDGMHLIWPAARTVYAFFILLISVSASGQDRTVLFREEFNDLENWRQLYFSKISKHSFYTIQKEKGNAFLRAESDASASGLIFRKEYDVYAYPMVRWRWKIDNVYQKGDVAEKSGDDYPIRIYILFKYDPATAPFGQRLKYGLARMIYGEYPPHSSLNYVWASKKQQQRIMANPYADEARMIFLEMGTEKIGRWVDEEINVIEDYHKAFGTSPPATASIAVMNDSDNTGESAVSYVDYIEVYRDRE